MSASGWVHLDVKCVKSETSAALLLILEDGDELWVPKSQISDEEDYDVGDCDCVVSVSEWWAERNGVGD